MVSEKNNVRYREIVHDKQTANTLSIGKSYANQKIELQNKRSSTLRGKRNMALRCSATKTTFLSRKSYTPS